MLWTGGLVPSCWVLFDVMDDGSFRLLLRSLLHVSRIGLCRSVRPVDPNSFTIEFNGCKANRILPLPSRAHTTTNAI